MVSKIGYAIIIRTHIMFLSSFMIYFFCICNLGSFPFVYLHSVQ